MVSVSEESPSGMKALHSSIITVHITSKVLVGVVPVCNHNNMAVSDTRNVAGGSDKGMQKLRLVTAYRLCLYYSSSLLHFFQLLDWRRLYVLTF